MEPARLIHINVCRERQRAASPMHKWGDNWKAENGLREDPGGRREQDTKGLERTGSRRERMVHKAQRRRVASRVARWR
jgi:hypothetical protein